MRLAHLYSATGECLAVAELPIDEDRYPLTLEWNARTFLRYGDEATDLYHEAASMDPTLDDALRELKVAIRDVSRAAMETFERKTGLSPCRIDILLIDVTSKHDERRRSFISDVRIGLDDF